jgi:hypothetical protein
MNDLKHEPTPEEIERVLRKLLTDFEAPIGAMGEIAPENIHFGPGKIAGTEVLNVGDFQTVDMVEWHKLQRKIESQQRSIESLSGQRLILYTALMKIKELDYTKGRSKEVRQLVNPYLRESWDIADAAFAAVRSDARAEGVKLAAEHLHHREDQQKLDEG